MNYNLCAFIFWACEEHFRTRTDIAMSYANSRIRNGNGLCIALIKERRQKKKNEKNDYVNDGGIYDTLRYHLYECVKLNILL